MVISIVFFFFQAEDGIRDLVRSRGLGDVYKRQSAILANPATRTAAIAACVLIFMMISFVMPNVADNRRNTAGDAGCVPSGSLAG